MDSTQKRLQKVMLYTKVASQVELKEQLGYKYSDCRLSEMMNGKRKLSNSTALRIIKAFPEISFEYLVTGEGAFITERQSSPIFHKIKVMENKVTEMENKIDFVYNISKK